MQLFITEAYILINLQRKHIQVYTIFQGTLWYGCVGGLFVTCGGSTMYMYAIASRAVTGPTATFTNTLVYWT